MTSQDVKAFMLALDTASKAHEENREDLLKKDKEAGLAVYELRTEGCQKKLREAIEKVNVLLSSQRKSAEGFLGMAALLNKIIKKNSNSGKKQYGKCSKYRNYRLSTAW